MVGGVGQGRLWEVIYTGSGSLIIFIKTSIWSVFVGAVTKLRILIRM